MRIVWKGGDGGDTDLSSEIMGPVNKYLKVIGLCDNNMQNILPVIHICIVPICHL